MIRSACVGSLALLFFGSPAIAQEAGDPWIGCFARVYDKAHLAKHRGQLVTAITVAINSRTPSGDQDPGSYAVRVAATLRDKSETFATLHPARCSTAGEQGPQLRCVLDGFFMGQFGLEQAGKNVRIVLRNGDGIVLVPGVDLGAFARLGPQNPEHAVFLLNPQSESACGDSGAGP